MRRMDIMPAHLAAPDVPTSPAPKVPPQKTNGPSFKDVLSGLGKRMDEGERSVQAAIEVAPKMGPGGELLTLQAGVYRYTETFELAAKLVDKATNAIKTTLQGQ
jgi:hypothetical protein